MAMQSAKSSGPGGYPIKFSKRFSNKLSKILLDMSNDSLAHGSLPHILTEASIALLFKSGKNNEECGSLLNCDIKILANVLTVRPETTMYDYHCTLRIYYYMLQTQLLMYPISLRL